MLYIVGTPIGNMEDVTLRALRVLKEVPLIAAEDTRKIKRLLDRYEIKARVTSYHKYSGPAKLSRLLGHLKEEDLALVSDAGMPGISDPGYELISAAIDSDIPVVPIPGPSAVIAALVASGLPLDGFSFVGFLPRKRADRQRLILSLATESHTTVAFETPHRLRAALEDLASVMGTRKIAVCRELTKLHEEVFRGTVAEAQAHFPEPRGEFTLVIEGSENRRQQITDDELRTILVRLKDEDLTTKEAVARASQVYGVPRNRAYQAWLILNATEETGPE